MIKELSCDISFSLAQAWEMINKNAKGIVFIIDSGKLSGVLTDGDIRRFLLGGGNLGEPAKNVMNKSFAFATTHDDKETIFKKSSPKLKVMPIVDDEMHLIDVYEYFSNQYIPVAIPDLKGNEFTYLVDAFLSTWISSTGKYIEKFENNFSSFCDTKHGVAVSNGTVAIQLALAALDIKNGDEVIIPDLTFAATINAVLHMHAKPVIVDVKADSWGIDPKEIEKAITPKTKAIIPVHLYGQPCDMEAIMSIAKEHKLYVIEDCAEAHGATYKEKKVGSFGQINCFSFFGNKVITTGEGGMCLTNDDALNDKLRVLRDHGMSKEKKYWHDQIGYNFRMTNLVASIGVAQLERIDVILENRKQIELSYRKELSDLSVLQFQNDSMPDRNKITWLVCATVGIDRDRLLEELKGVGIDARPFFYPLSEMPIYEKYLFSNKQSIKLSKIGINFPTNENVRTETIQKIKTIITKLTN
jgi:perosamine synthetase